LNAEQSVSGALRFKIREQTNRNFDFSMSGE